VKAGTAWKCFTKKDGRCGGKAVTVSYEKAYDGGEHCTDGYYKKYLPSTYSAVASDKTVFAWPAGTTPSVSSCQDLCAQDADCKAISFKCADRDCLPPFSGSPAKCDDYTYTDPIHFMGNATCEPFKNRLNAMINQYVPGANASWFCSDHTTRKDGWSLLSYAKKVDQTNMRTMWKEIANGTDADVTVFNSERGIIYFDCRSGKIATLNQLVRDWKPPRTCSMYNTGPCTAWKTSVGYESYNLKCTARTGEGEMDLDILDGILDTDLAEESSDQ